MSLGAQSIVWALLPGMLIFTGCREEEPSPAPAAAPSPTGAAPFEPPADPKAGGDPASEPPDPRREIVLETGRGQIVIRVDVERAPRTAANVLGYVRGGFYDGLIFHRALAGGFVQTGAWQADGERRRPTGRPVPLEIDDALRPTAGAALLSRSLAPGSGTAEILLLAADQPSLHGEYAVFGRVIEGLDLVTTLSEEPTRRHGREPDWPEEPAVIRRAYLR